MQSGNKLTEEHDNNFDGTFTPDTVYYYTYDAGGNLTQVAYDSDHNGFYDYIEKYTLRCKRQKDENGN